MASFDAYLKAFAAITTLTFAIVVLAGRRDRRAPIFLGAFLLLIAGNQAAETIRALVTDPAAADRWWSAATVFAAFDPLALFLFARAHGDAPRSRWPVLAVATGSTLLALGGISMTLGTPRTFVVTALLVVFTAVVYTAVFVRFLRQSARHPEATTSRTLVYAAALVTVTPWHQGAHVVAVAYLLVAQGIQDTPIPFHVDAIMWFVLPIAILLGAHAAGRLGEPRHARRTALLALGLGFVVTIVVNASSFVWVYRGGTSPTPPPAWMPDLITLGRASAALRWILFGALVSRAVVGDDLLAMSLARRRAAARILVALGMIGLVGLLVAAIAVVAGPEAVALRPIDWLLLVALILSTQGFRPLIDRVATRLYGVPMPQDHGAAQETYRAAVLQALAEGRDVRDDAQLVRLRAELGLDPTQAELVARVAEGSHAVPLVAGQLIAGRYRVVRLLARGGAGRVFLARDETLARDVVLKEVPHETSDDEAALREARAAGTLAHPNVVVVHDVLKRAGASLLVTEYLAGGSLAERVRDQGHLPLDEGLRLLEGILAGLQAVHAEGLVHRDLKPENVLLTERGEPKLADFGIARARRGVTARFDEPDAFVGTPEFMAPEQRDGRRATFATDLYGVGRIARAAIAAPLPPSIESVVTKALSEAPADRYQTAAEMRQALAIAVRA